jgi:peptidoglycan/xylan/chitin deacetylase (PgdA/CDA1 family)
MRFVEMIEETLAPADRPEAERRMLNWGEIREMHQAGIGFGSHTVTHPILSLLPEKELAKELTESKDELTQRLGTPLKAFAYPNGKLDDYNELSKIMLKNCGYTCAVTTQNGTNRSETDPFELRRGQPWHLEIDLFRLTFFLQRHELTDVRN